MKTLSQFAKNRSGNVAIVTSFAMLPIMGFLAFSIDLGAALEAKARLDAAADSAALAGIAATSNYLSSYTGTTNIASAATNCATTQSVQCSAQTVGVNAATAAFQANAAQLQDIGALTLKNAAFLVGSSAVTGSITYTFTKNNNFAGIIGIPTTTIGNTITSVLSIPHNINVYFIIDNSESMGIGATANDQSLMYNSQAPFNGGAGCALACHQGSSASENAAHATGALLRIDVARTALINTLTIFKNANNSKISVAIYVLNNNIQTLYSLSNNLPNAITAANGILLADTTNSPQNAGSNVTYALNQFNSNIPKATGGSTQNYVILLTDGMQDNSWYHGNGNAGSDPNFQALPDESAGRWQEIDPTPCTTIKNNGYTIMTLYTPYIVPNPINITPGYEWAYADVEQSMPKLLGAMQKCATTPSNSISASDSTDVNAAMATFANQILQKAQLTQ